MNIPTALSFLIENEDETFNQYVTGEAFPILEKLLIEFARLHVQAALVAANEYNKIDQYQILHKVIDIQGNHTFTDLSDKSIITSYPLTNIK